jgi:hypothetical protein
MTSFGAQTRVKLAEIDAGNSNEAIALFWSTFRRRLWFRELFKDVQHITIVLRHTEALNGTKRDHSIIRDNEVQRLRARVGPLTVGARKITSLGPPNLRRRAADAFFHAQMTRLSFAVAAAHNEVPMRAFGAQ